MHGGTVVQRDGLVVGVEPGVDLPLVGGADLQEGRAAARGAEAGELEPVAQRSAAAVEVVEDVAVSLTGVEDEQVVAAHAVERVCPAAAVDAVVARVALDKVGG